MTTFGLISKAELLDSGGSIAEKLNLNGNFFLSKLPFLTILSWKASFSELAKSSKSKMRQSTSNARMPVFLILKTLLWAYVFDTSVGRDIVGLAVP